MKSAARNACDKDRISIIVPKVRQKKSITILSHLRRFDFSNHCFAGVPCYALHRLPGNWRSFGTVSGVESFTQSKSLRCSASLREFFLVRNEELGAIIFRLRLQCVRDWSGILCERCDSRASKDRAESPTASPERQKKWKLKTENWKFNGSKSKVQSSEFRVQSSESKVQSSKFRVQSSKFNGSEFKVQWFKKIIPHS